MNYSNPIRILVIIVIVKSSSGNDLGSLIDGVTPLEDVKFNGDSVDASSDKVVLEKEDGKLVATYFGEGNLSLRRSTGLPSGAAQELIKIIKNALGSRYRLLATLKRGGRLVTLRDERRLNEILESQKQRVEVYLKDNLIDLSKASLIETTTDSSALEPIGFSGILITVSRDGIAVKTPGEEDEVKITITKGLNQRQIDKLKDNFYSLVAEKASFLTGLPKPLIELMQAGRDTTVERLSQILSPAERIVIGNKVVDIDTSTKFKASSETTLEPDNLPKVKIVWKKGNILRVESENGESIYVEYSNGVEPRLIGRLVDNLHRAITLRMGLISWSNKLLGSIPPQLESVIKELKSKIQKRTIYVDGTEVNLSEASVVKTTDDFVLYRVRRGSLLRVHYDGTISTEGGEALTLEITPGISEIQAANVLAKMNQIFSTAISFSTRSGETLLNDESNRKMLQKLLRGIKPKEKITIDNEVIQFGNATVSKYETDYTEYSVDGLEDVVLTKFTKGDVKVVGKGRTLRISRSTGLSLEFLNKLIMGITSVMPRKRWFYNFGQKTDKNYFRGHKLQSSIEEISKMVQKQTVTMNGKEIDLTKAIIMDVNDEATEFSPEIDSNVKITKFSNGDIQTMTTGNEVLGLEVSPGITSLDAEILLKNIQSIVGDRFKVGTKRPENVWCSSGNIRKLLSWLLNKIYPTIVIESKEENTSKNDPKSLTRSAGQSNNNGLFVSQYDGRGKNVTSTHGGKLFVSLSTGLTEEMTRDLVDYLITMLQNKEDVIRMVTGSLSDYKVQKIKEKIQKMIQHSSIMVDTEAVKLQKAILIEKKTNYSSYSPSSKRDVTVKHNKVGSIEVDSADKHRVSVAIGPGITKEQAEQLYQNVLSAFKQEFSEIIRLPIGFLGLFSNFKKYLMKSYFYSSSVPKEFASINGKEIYLTNMTHVEDDEGFTVIDPQGLSNVSISKHSDGTLEVVSKQGGNINVIRTTGLNDDQINRILKAVEFKLGMKNKLFRYSTDQLWTPPDRPESLEVILRSFVTSQRIFLDEVEVNMGNSKMIESYEGCSLYKMDDQPHLIVKRCEDGQISVDYREPKTISLQILPGISPQQAKYILKSLIKTIRTKSSNIKLLTNFPDIFFQLLADGRLNSLEKLLTVLIPREEINMDGKRVKLESFEENFDEEYTVIESTTYPGLQAVRFKNGSLEVKSWNGGRLDVLMNSGLSSQLIAHIFEAMKEETSEHLAPILQILDAVARANSSTIVNIVNAALKSRNSKINLDFILDAIEEEIKKKIHSFNIDDSLMKTLALIAVQKQDVHINERLINFETAAVVESTENSIVYTTENLENIKITTYDNGRIVVEALHEEPIAIRLSAGIPRQMIDSLTYGLQKLTKKLDSDEDFSKRLKEQLVSYFGRLQEAVTYGINMRRKIFVDDQVIELTKNIEIEDIETSKVYKKDDILITVDEDGGTRVETITAAKMELDISSGLISEPVIAYLTNNSATLLHDLLHSYKHSDTLIPLMTKMKKILDGMINSLERSIEIYIDGKSINLPSLKLVESTKNYRILSSQDIPGLKLKSYYDGRLIIELADKYHTLELFVSQGLPPADLGKLSTNIEAMFSSINPIELFADLFDLLPKNFFILAQNMDRVLSIMNLIKF